MTALGSLILMVCILTHLPTLGQFSPVGSQKHQLVKTLIYVFKVQGIHGWHSCTTPTFFGAHVTYIFQTPMLAQVLFESCSVCLQDPNVRVCNLLFLYHHLLLKKKDVG